MHAVVEPGRGEALLHEEFERGIEDLAGPGVLAALEARFVLGLGGVPGDSSN